MLTSPGHRGDPLPPEATLIEILHDKVGATFAFTVTKIDAAVVVTMALAGHGFGIGSGPTFEAAFHSMAGVDLPREDLLGEAPSPSQH